MTKGSVKGSNFEREICKKLSLWWSEDLRDDIFWRTSISGARATTRSKKGQGTSYSQGDVTFIDPVGKPFIAACLIEIKRGYTNEISVLDFIDRKRGEPLLWKWWRRLEKDRRQIRRKYSLLIFKRNQRRTCIMLDKEMWGEIIDYNGYFVGPLLNMNDLRIVNFNDFFEWVNPGFFKRDEK